MSDIHSLLVAAILGVVEGLTEFLPVSSTGHMIIVGHLLGFEGDTANTFEVVIQLGSILAVVVMFWRRLFGLIGIHFGKPPAHEGGQRPFVAYPYPSRHDPRGGDGADFP